jgi:hypothetical protein
MQQLNSRTVLTNIAYPGSGNSLNNNRNVDQGSTDSSCPEFMKEMYYQANTFVEQSKEA